MPKHLFSKINLSGSRAVVSDPDAGQTLAHVRRVTSNGTGFWEAVCAQTGALLLPRIETERAPDHKRRKTAWGAPLESIEVSLGEVLRDLRGVLCR